MLWHCKCDNEICHWLGFTRREVNITPPVANVHMMKTGATANKNLQSVDKSSMRQDMKEDATDISSQDTTPNTHSNGYTATSVPICTVFDFESRTSLDGYETDPDDANDAAEGNALVNFFQRPFVAHEDSKLFAVRGRVKSQNDLDSMCDAESESKYPTSHSGCGTPLKCNTLRFQDLCNINAFKLYSSQNVSSVEARSLKELSSKDAAMLVGYQICLLFDDDDGHGGDDKFSKVDPEDIDDSKISLDERIRVIIAYKKEWDNLLLRRCSKYLLIKSNGTCEWTELRKTEKKRGKLFSLLRKVCK